MRSHNFMGLTPQKKGVKNTLNAHLVLLLERERATLYAPKVPKNYSREKERGGVKVKTLLIELTKIFDNFAKKI